MSLFGPTKTPAQKAAIAAQKQREKAARREQEERERAAAAERRKEQAIIAEKQRRERAERARLAQIAANEAAAKRFEEMPVFIVRETREVSVKAEDMQDAIALASAAFKEGQDEDFTIKWHKPYGIEGDTIDKIRVVNVKALGAPS